MKISLITACRNSERWIGSALDSVLRQSGADYELWVIDGGSTDRTLEIVQSYSSAFQGRMRWISEPDHGLYDAINKGIRRATGEVVGILNSDDTFASDQVLTGVTAAFADDSVDCVFGDVRFVRDANPSRTVRYYSSRWFRPWMFRFGFMPAHPTCYIRKHCFDRFGTYKTDYRISADYELLIRFLWVGRIRYRYLNTTMVTMRLGGVSTRSPRSTVVLNREIVRGCRENGIWTCLPLLTLKYLFKVFELVNTREKGVARAPVVN
jgi:glycosyltransferase involved in cell wall biosynthesis